MPDACYVQLLDQLKHDYTNAPAAVFILWLEESFSLRPSELAELQTKNANLILMGNRIDTIAPFQHAGFNAQLSDFDASALPAADHIYFRVTKERLLSHHLLNSSCALLKPKGTLYLVGKKDDGIKTYASNCTKHLGLLGSLKKNKDTYSASFGLRTKKNTTASISPLKTDDYHRLRHVADVNIEEKAFRIFSKPGVYGWKKVDQGTQFLVDTLIQQKRDLGLEMLSGDNRSALDLGCGSGHLSLAAHALGFGEIVATDNNIAAIAATELTCTENGVEVSAFIDNCAANITDRFDTILCNPPFHKGKDTNNNLTELFVNTAARLLSRHGCAYFVTNTFIGIEKHIERAGLKFKTVDRNGQFKVMKIERQS